MQTDDDLTDRHRNTLFAADIGGDFAQHAHGALDRAAGAAGVLNVEVPLGGAGAALAVKRQLVDLAAEADHQHAAEIHMAGVTGKRPMQHVHAVTRRAHAAALIVNDRHETVDAVIMRQDRTVGLVGNRPTDRGGTVHAGDDADIIARRRPSVGAAITHEGTRPVLGTCFFRSGIGRRSKAVVFEMQIVAVNVVARFHISRGAADRLAVFHDRCAKRNVRYGDLVAGVDLLPRRHARNIRSLGDLRRCDRDIVSGRQDDPRLSVQFLLPDETPAT